MSTGTFLDANGPQHLADPPSQPCPDWCLSPSGHGWDAEMPDGRTVRGHVGAWAHGGSFSLGAEEFSDGTLKLTVHFEQPPMTAHWLRVLSKECLEAAQWLENHRHEEKQP